MAKRFITELGISKEEVENGLYLSGSFELLTSGGTITNPRPILQAFCYSNYTAAAGSTTTVLECDLLTGNIFADENSDFSSLTKVIVGDWIKWTTQDGWTNGVKDVDYEIRNVITGTDWHTDGTITIALDSALSLGSPVGKDVILVWEYEGRCPFDSPFENVENIWDFYPIYGVAIPNIANMVDLIYRYDGSSWSAGETINIAVRKAVLKRGFTANYTAPGSRSSNNITLSPTGSIRQNKINYSDDEISGFYLGYDDRETPFDYKFNIGDTDKHLKWSGSGLVVRGNANIFGGTATLQSLETNRGISGDYAHVSLGGSGENLIKVHDTFDNKVIQYIPAETGTPGSLIIRGKFHDSSLSDSAMFNDLGIADIAARLGTTPPIQDSGGSVYMEADTNFPTGTEPTGPGTIYTDTPAIGLPGRFTHGTRDITLSIAIYGGLFYDGKLTTRPNYQTSVFDVTIWYRLDTAGAWTVVPTPNNTFRLTSVEDEDFDFEFYPIFGWESSIISYIGNFTIDSGDIATGDVQFGLTIDEYVSGSLQPENIQVTSLTASEPVIQGAVSYLDDLLDVNAPSPNGGDVLTYSGGNWINQAPSSGSTNLRDLTDTDIPTAVTPGQVLVWQTDDTWVPETPSANANDGQLTLTAGVGLRFSTGDGVFTANQAGNETWNLEVDLSELTDMTASVTRTQDELIILDNGADSRKLISEIPLSAFDPGAYLNHITSGYNSGSVIVQAGTPTAPSQGDIWFDTDATYSFALEDLTDVDLSTSAGGPPSPGDSLVYDSSGYWVPGAPAGGGTITGVTAGDGLTGGGTSGSVTLNVVAGTGITAEADSVRLANAAANTVKANNTAGSAVPTDVALGTNTVLGRQGSNIAAISVGTNTVLGRVGSNIVAAQLATGQIANDAVTYAKMQNVVTANRILGSLSAGGVITELTGTQVTSLLDNFSTSTTTKGTVPGSNGGGSGVYLNGNGGWTTPSGSGDVTKVGTPADNQIGVWTGDGTIEGTSIFTWNNSTSTMTVGTGSSSITLGGGSSGHSNYLNIGKGFDVQSGIKWNRGATTDSGIYVNASENMIFTIDETNALSSNQFQWQANGGNILTLSDTGVFDLTGSITLSGTVDGKDLAKVLYHTTSGYNSGDITVQAGEPTGPSQGDIWFDTDATYTVDSTTITTSSANSAFKVPFADTTASTTGNYGLLQDTTATFTYNPSSNTLTVGTVNATSDIRLKTNIQDYIPKSLSFKAKQFDIQNKIGKIGYIAQEVEKELPLAVSKNEEGILSLDYTMILVAKIAELEARLESLENGK